MPLVFSLHQEPHRRLLPLALLLLAFAVPSLAAPRVGLVLGGGGARGAAHIGVLEVLQRERVPVACIAATSMGALVAGAWAAGLTPEEMRRNLTEMDWRDIFIDSPESAEMSQRNRQIQRRYLSGTETGIGPEGVRYQTGVVSGQKIKLFFNRLIGAERLERHIEDLPLPLSILSTDIGTGERVVLRQGPLSMAMRASMSVPGLLAPVEHAGHKLVDGGLVDNLPVGEVRTRCQPDVIIAVDVSSPLLPSAEVGSLLTVSAQMIGILTQQNSTRSRAQLGTADIYIQPVLDGIGSVDFQRHDDAIAQGRAAAEAVVSRLQQLSMTASDYASWENRLRAPRPQAKPVDRIEIVGLRHTHPLSLERFITIEPGDTPSAERIDRDLLRIYGDGRYESVDYTVLNERERTVLRILPVEKPWGPDYLRFGLKLQADTSEGSNFGLRGAYHRTQLNALGGEFLAHTELGTQNRLLFNLYQPLEARQRFFSEVELGLLQERINLYENNNRIAQYKVREEHAALWLGYNARTYGALRLGWRQNRQRYTPDIGSLTLPNVRASFGGWQLDADFDRFDSLYFPSRGWSANMRYFSSAKEDYSKLDLELRGAFKLRDTVFTARLASVDSPRGQLPIYDAGRLGGFLNMTAYATNQLLGDRVRYAGVRMEQIIGRLPLGLRGDMRIGIAFEAARLGRRFSETRNDDWFDSTALYLGGETPFGPAYIGLGYSGSGVANLFLFIGTP